MEKKGDKITLRFAESLQSNGELFTANLRDAKVTDVYTFSNSPLGTGGWEPSFIYHGFRYVEVSGFPGEPTTNNFEGKLCMMILKQPDHFKHRMKPSIPFIKMPGGASLPITRGCR
jgi:alpha-L-rhamnosidase